MERTTPKGRKMKIIIWILAILGIIFLGMLSIHRNDCYDMHLGECNFAHSNNMTYNHCSGFWTEPSDFDLSESGCLAVHPLEDCEEEVPHGCNLAENEYADGICIPFTNKCLIW